MKAIGLRLFPLQVKRQEDNANSKEDSLMWSFMTQPGLATAVLDLTDAFAWLGVGLLGLTALTAWGITCIAVRHQLSERATGTATTPPSYQEAA